jgi:2,3-bisphosphoglycerate-dependent phosphoglycerate mutase
MPHGESGAVLWMIRHGQSTGNAGRETNDPGMIPLSVTGERQAAHVVDVFDHGPDLILTSPFLRARQTARPTLDRFPHVHVEEWPIQEFSYLGHLHGRATTAAERRPLVDAYWSAADPSDRDDDRSESFLDVYARAAEFLKRLAQVEAGSAAAFTHGLFMRVVLWVILTGETAPDADSMRRFHRFRSTYLIPNCSIIELTLHPAHGRRILGAATRHLPPALQTGE